MIEDEVPSVLLGLVLLAIVLSVFWFSVGLVLGLYFG